MSSCSATDWKGKGKVHLLFYGITKDVTMCGEVLFLCKSTLKYVKCTLIQALRLCTGHTAHRGVEVYT